MKISELITFLEKCKKEFGDCKVYNCECGALTEDLNMAYAKDVEAYSHDLKEDNLFTGLFLNLFEYTEKNREPQ